MLSRTLRPLCGSRPGSRCPSLTNEVLVIVQLFAVVAPVFLCAGAGYAWGRFGDGFDTRTATRLITTVGAPCLIFSSTVSADVGSEALSQMALWAAVSMGLSGVVAAFLVRVFGWPAHTWFLSLVFGNAGNMGLSVSLFAFGRDGLALAMPFFAVSSILHMGFGGLVASGSRDLTQVLKTPLVWASLLAVLQRVTGFWVPEPVLKAATLLGDVTIPLMLLSLGQSLSRLRPRFTGPGPFVALIRPVLGAFAGVTVVTLFGVEGLPMKVLILESAMPIAVFNYLFAQQYGRAPADVASAILLSTLFGFLWVPLVLYGLGL